MRLHSSSTKTKLTGTGTGKRWCSKAERPAGQQPVDPQPQLACWEIYERQHVERPPPAPPGLQPALTDTKLEAYIFIEMKNRPAQICGEICGEG